ncbi:peptidase domain-containing ABC transporter [Sphingobacterium arenae]|uniref:Peptidase domain-containing ABC transporter n=2 Tax=Sphingobacterium arenae TaxID=1280598 RepID=A0ABR7XZF6_9SPHI|nr:peptidase domain-containing ABC transporter [Sphingobacterium arenae]MBD1424444.1 peptidase domain-containing ABC transporter [Sphingobacterium arenae]
MFRPFPIDRQLDMMDCGPACLKSIAKFHGKYYSLQYLRDKCGLSREGVSFLDLSYAAESIGLRSISIKATIHDLYEKVPLPCIVHWSNSHFIVVYKTTAKRIYVSDPAKGLLSYSHQEFTNNWCKPEYGDKKGVLLALEPQADFKLINEGEKRNRKKTIDNLIGYFTPYKKNFANLFVVMFVVTLLQALLPFISKAVIDVGIQRQDIDFINIVLIANIAIILSITLSNAVRDWILVHVTSRINIALISDYLMKLMKLPITFFETKMTGDILQRANDHERIRSFIMNNSLNMIFSVLTFVVFGIILWIYNTFIFYTFLIGSTLYILWVLAFLKLRRKLDWNYFELISKNQSYWVETIEGMQDIKVNNYEKAKRWKWENIQARLYKVNLRSMTVNNMQNLGAQCIDSIKNLLITFFCAKAVIAGEITFGVMISTQFIIGMLSGPVQQFVSFIVSAQFAHLSFLRLNEIHQQQEEEENTGSNSITLTSDKSLILRNVFFQYTANSPMVINGVHLNIPAGKVTAIVGDSGSGKSTLLKLLLRLYRPSHGEILIGNMNLNNISLKQWRDKVGVVMQDGKIFNDTILNNIVLDDEKIDYERLGHAAETANIAKEIEHLPLGYQTMMGEQGRGLSGGQKQRVLIARALYKNPDFLFFDEATNSLDTINEQKIIASLENVFKNKTVIVVAHRLSTIRKADQIVVMRKGRVVEIGSHETLMKRRGLYYQLVESQVDLVSNIAENAQEKVNDSEPKPQIDAKILKKVEQHMESNGESMLASNTIDPIEIGSESSKTTKG